ncbi:MAG: type II toxin-antitoxin system RelE/ParE family toxin [Phormidesmis sp.]
MSYKVEISDTAMKDLKKLNSQVRTRILKKIAWLGEHFESLVPQPLTGDLSGLFKLRVGDYRVVYSFMAEISIISIQRVGHRRDVYD